MDFPRDIPLKNKFTSIENDDSQEGRDVGVGSVSANLFLSFQFGTQFEYQIIFSAL